MATQKRSYQAKQKKSKFSVSGTKFLRFKTLVLHTCRHALGAAAATWRKGLAFYQGMPAGMRIIAIYFLVLIVALSIFFWRFSMLRVAEPPAADPPFDWSVYFPTEPDPNSQGEELSESNSGTDDEPAVAGAPEKSFSEEADAAATFVKGEWPVKVKGELFYGFHETVIQNGFGYPLYYTSKGIAIKADRGSEVVASWEGTVIKTMALDKPHGQSVMIEHDNGLVSYYGALQKVSVNVGDQVSRGQVIGRVAPGFESEPDYLYVEILKDGRVANPVEYLLR